MSGAPKRLHEEGSHSSHLKRPIEETSIFYSPGKLIYPAGNDFRIPFESMHDGRLAKVHRIEPRDADKRTSLLHRMPSSPSNCSDHPITAENKSDLRNSKDARHVKTENREAKAETRESYTDVKLDTRVDEKEIRCDRVPHSDFKGDVKFEKDSYTAANSHFNFKEGKEHNRGKRCCEPATDGLDARRVRHGNASELAKNLLTVERDETHEAVGENKIDMKGEEKIREKDRKRKDENHRDLGEKDKDRNDHQNNLLVAGSMNERKELLREERETERWKRERSDTQKDTEKDPNKGEPSNTNDKESLQYEKEVVDGPARTSEKEIVASQLQHHKDDSWRAVDRDLKDRGRQTDVDVADKNEKHGEFYDKELDDGCADGDVVTERNGEVFGYGVQEHRRMLRSRGTPQAPRREPHFRSSAQDNEGSI